MKVTKKLILPVAGLVLVGAGLHGVAQVSAQTSTAKPKSLVQEIVDAFHLDKAKVQMVFDTHKSEMQQFHQTKYEDRLNRAVTDGKLTSAQKDAILVEHNKLQTEMQEALKQPAGTDRRTAMDKIHQEALDWAKQNNVDAKWLMMGGPGHGQGRGMRMHMPEGMHPDQNQ